jgi:hypothetical protein
MADNFQVSCINKTDRQNRHERIKNIGGVTPSGERWKITEADAIAGMEAGKWRFWVHGGGQSTWVIIATHLGRKYLKTEGDTTTKDNLLSLPECP